MKRSSITRVTAGILLMGAMATLAAIEARAESQAFEAFYSPSTNDLPGAPGTLIRSQPLTSAPDDADAHLVLYRSVGLEGEPIAVSALIIVPRTPAPVGGRPVIAWAHPTSGVVPKCAPSLMRDPYASIQGLKAMIDGGYVVVATDYPGLGTGGIHPYLIGKSEARAVIDSVRAARALPQAQAGTRYAVWGHSQGGQAALFTGIIADEYAPELQLIGVAAAAPATDLATLLRDDFATAGGKNLTAMTLWSWSQLFDAPMSAVLSPEALPTVDALVDKCIETLVQVLERKYMEKPLEKNFLTVTDVTLVEPWQGYMKGNTPGVMPRQMPMFLSQGTGDTTVRPAVTAAYMQSLCRAGSPVRMVILPKVIHAFIARDTADDAFAWMDARFDGLTPPNDCQGDEHVQEP